MYSNVVHFQNQLPPPTIEDPNQSVQIQSETQAKPTINGGVQHSSPDTAEQDEENDQSECHLLSLQIKANASNGIK